MSRNLDKKIGVESVPIRSFCCLCSEFLINNQNDFQCSWNLIHVMREVYMPVLKMFCVQLGVDEGMKMCFISWDVRNGVDFSLKTIFISVAEVNLVSLYYCKYASIYSY